jgi:hypothetical protein
MCELFNVEEFLLINKNNEISKNLYVYDRLCKKIDVVKKIYKFYSIDLSTKKNDKEISSDAYRVILDKLIMYEVADFKILNTALKLNDILKSKKLINVGQHDENKMLLKNKMKIFI